MERLSGGRRRRRLRQRTTGEEREREERESDVERSARDSVPLGSPGGACRVASLCCDSSRRRCPLILAILVSRLLVLPRPPRSVRSAPPCVPSTDTRSTSSSPRSPASSSGLIGATRRSGRHAPADWGQATLLLLPLHQLTASPDRKTPADHSIRLQY